MNSSVELSETTLESLIEKINSLIQNKVAHLVPVQITQLYDKIPQVHTMLEYRGAQFIEKVAIPLDEPQITSYSDQLLSKPFEYHDLPKDTQNVLHKFFEDEKNRSVRIRDVVLKRFLKQGGNPEICDSFSTYMESISSYLLKCQEGIGHLQSSTFSTYTANDIFCELSHNYAKRKRNAMLDDFYIQIRRYPQIKRKQIYTRIFDKIHNNLQIDSDTSMIPLCISTEKELDNQLLKFAHRFDLEADLATHEGQKFLYFADKIFDKLWKFLKLPPVRGTIVPSYEVSASIEEKALLHQIQQQNSDIKLKMIFDQLFSMTNDQILLNTKESAQYYNMVVGNQIRGQIEPVRPLLPGQKILAWFELRYLHSKFQSHVIISILNYFEYVKIFIDNPDTDLKVKTNQSYQELIEISDSNGPFLF